LVGHTFTPPPHTHTPNTPIHTVLPSLVPSFGWFGLVCSSGLVSASSLTMDIYTYRFGCVYTPPGSYTVGWVSLVSWISFWFVTTWVCWLLVLVGLLASWLLSFPWLVYRTPLTVPHLYLATTHSSLWLVPVYSWFTTWFLVLLVLFPASPSHVPHHF